MALNPIREIRMKLGQSLEQFARECEVHHQALYLNECGCYPHILPQILQHLIALGANEESIQREYLRYVTEKRAKNQFPSGITLPDPTLAAPPFLLFRKKLGKSRMAFAKTYCVHPASLYSLEMGEAQSLPKQLQEALLDCGLPLWQVQELDFRTEEFAFNRVRRRASLSA